MENLAIQLKKFKPSKMSDNATCVIVAESEGGKTVLGIDLMWHKRHLPAWYLFSTTEACSGRLSQTIPPSYTYPTFDLDALAKIFKHQQAKISSEKYTRELNDEEKIKYKGVPSDELPLDVRFKKNPCIGGYYEDCFASKKIFNQPLVQDLFKNGRHKMMFSILPCQYVMNLPIECRTQVKYWFILREDRPNIRKKLFAEIGGACGTFEVFNAIMDSCTNEYGCVVIDNRCKSREIADRVFWYKAAVHEPFKVGCARYWKFHKLNYQDTKTEAYDPYEDEARAALGRKRKRDDGLSAAMNGFGGNGGGGGTTASAAEHARAGMALAQRFGLVPGGSAPAMPEQPLSTAELLRRAAPKRRGVPNFNVAMIDETTSAKR
jgi:hypothetical protein